MSGPTVSKSVAGRSYPVPSWVPPSVGSTVVFEQFGVAPLLVGLSGVVVDPSRFASAFRSCAADGTLYAGGACSFILVSVPSLGDLIVCVWSGCVRAV